jgi:DNA-binding NarL/FixJ family response regulator
LVTVRVLLVDDVVEVRRLVRLALRLRGGFEVVGEAADGADAVRLAQDLHPDVVVLDLGLPDLAGREVLTRICLYSPGSKVVVFSGMDSEDREWIARRVKGYVL